MQEPLDYPGYKRTNYLHKVAFIANIISLLFQITIIVLSHYELDARIIDWLVTILNLFKPIR